MSKISKNLYLDRAIAERAERYAARYRTSVSQLVSEFLSRLPAEADEPELPMAVRNLYGIAAGSEVDEHDYSDHLLRKYGA